MENKTLTRRRITWIDTAKGICILLVVLHHTSMYIHIKYYPLADVFLTFRMPLYFILSGLFFKPYEGFIGFAKRKINKLIIPYIFFFVIGGVVLPVIVFNLFGIRVWYYNDYGLEALLDVFTEKKVCNPVIWFLLCLFEVNMLFYMITAIAKRWKDLCADFIMILLSIFLGCIGLTMAFLHINIPCYMDSALSALPFFCFGYILRNKTRFLYWEKTFQSVTLSFVFILVAVAFIHFNNHGVLNFIGNSYGGTLGYIELYPYGIIGTICVLSLSRIVGNLPVISYIGRYSIIILCTHIYIIQITAYLTSLLGINNFINVFILTVLISLFIIPLFKQYLGYFTAQKDVIKIV